MAEKNPKRPSLHLTATSDAARSCSAPLAAASARRFSSCVRIMVLTVRMVTEGQQRERNATPTSVCSHAAASDAARSSTLSISYRVMWAV
jgi:hypothetical protein